MELEEAPVTGGGRGSALSLHRGRGLEAAGFVPSRVLHDKDSVGSVVSTGIAAGATGEMEDEEDEDDEPSTPCPMQPGIPSHIPGDEELVSWIRRCRKNSLGWREITPPYFFIPQHMIE